MKGFCLQNLFRMMMVKAIRPCVKNNIYNIGIVQYITAKLKTFESFFVQRNRNISLMMVNILVWQA